MKLLVFIFNYNPIHKLIKSQFKTSYVSLSHCLYLGVASRSLADVDMKSQSVSSAVENGGLLQNTKECSRDITVLHATH